MGAPAARTLAIVVLVCALGLVVLTGAVVLGATTGVDAAGRSLAGWSGPHGLRPSLRFIEVAFGPGRMSLVVAVLALALALRRHLRAAVFVVLASVVTTLTTTVLKLVVGRPRPPWQLVDHVLSNGSFPSGHASSSAVLMASLVILAAHLRRRAAVVAAAVASALVVPVVAADRVLLGRHYPTDVVGGVLLGTALACAVALSCGMAVRPGPGGRRDTGAAPTAAVPGR